MRASTELFLYELWSTADVLLRPTWRNLRHDDFEAWARREGLLRRIGELERQKLLERQPTRTTDAKRIVRLTEAGRLAALGGRDPLACWGRSWDERWRIVLFDLPFDAEAVRVKLHRLLRNRHFGYLQGSVWVTPDPVADVCAVVDTLPVDPESFIIFEGRPATGESDAAVVQGAWDFAEINRRYERHLDVLKTAPRALPAGAAGRTQLRGWAQREHQTWKEAVARDPLLPLPLLPADYRGRAAWSARCETLSRLARQLA